MYIRKSANIPVDAEADPAVDSRESRDESGDSDEANIQWPNGSPREAGSNGIH